MTEGSLYTPPWGSPANYSSQVKTYGGRQLWQVYLAMTCEHNNTWWYADPLNTFDYEMFIGLMILQEADIHFTPGGGDTNVTLTSDYLVRAELVTKVVGTVMKYGGFRNYSCSGESCLSSIFNFWADHSQVARNLIDDYYHLVYHKDTLTSSADTTLNEYAGGGPAGIGGYYHRTTNNTHHNY
ncbi:MAG: hypothetical protein ABI904_07460 [Chloroflexota bacterium]